MKEKLEKTKGITLIALVVTIVVLIILAGITIGTLTGDNSIINRARSSKELTERTALEEQIEAAIIVAEQKKRNPTLDDVIAEIEKIDTVTGVNRENGDVENIFGDPIKGKLDDYLGKTSGDEVDKPEPPKGKSDGSWTGEVNSPKLGDRMTAVYWDEENREIEGDTGENWYNYVAGDNSTDTRTSHWANAKIEDSYFVWIPRYEYKFLSGEGTSTAGKIEIKFIPTSQTTADVGYKIHPAFINGTANKFKNGEWDSELAGIWVGKYESSHSDAEINREGSAETLKVKPSVRSWRSITIGNAYDVAYKYARDKESHLMKNSEWGAVVYLAHSQYGRNGNEITLNNNRNCVTGIAGDSVLESSSTATNNTYSTEKGVLASSTGNIYGIYDLSGGAYEYVAAYITDGSEQLSNGSTFVAKTTADAEGYKTLSTKYATVYPYNSEGNRSYNNYSVYKNAEYGYGDAILETSASHPNR